MLKLGPIVGHTTDESARIWIAVDRDPDGYTLELNGAARPIPFTSTEPDCLEFGTAIAEATGLSPDTRYTFTIRDAGGAATGSGSVRTFPPPGEAADLCFSIAGASFFPSIKAVNSTLTIIPKTLWVADHIKARLGIAA